MTTMPTMTIGCLAEKVEEHEHEMGKESPEKLRKLRESLSLIEKLAEKVSTYKYEMGKKSPKKLKKRQKQLSDRVKEFISDISDDLDEVDKLAKKAFGQETWLEFKRYIALTLSEPMSYADLDDPHCWLTDQDLVDDFDDVFQIPRDDFDDEFGIPRDDWA